MASVLHLGRDRLTLSALRELVSGLSVPQLAPEAVARIALGQRTLEALLAPGQPPVYGIDTGFGALCDTRIAPDQLGALQHNLLRSHAAGTGPAASTRVVALMLMLKAQSLAAGHSGVRQVLVERLLLFFARGVRPVVPSVGSLGASGDLAPLAHLALPLIGEGEVWLDGEQMTAAAAHARLGLTPLKLSPKEGLALINGTQYMGAVGAEVLVSLYRLLDWADALAALSAVAFSCHPEPYHPALQQLKQHPGQTRVAARLWALLGGEPAWRAPKQAVQDPYAFRCVPQVHGTAHEAAAWTSATFEREWNAVSDNPNLFPDLGLALSGGNFHGQPLATAFDLIALTLAQLGSISERRTYQLVSGARGLPPFLARDPGLESGLMIAQYTAAALVNVLAQAATPHSAYSVPSSAGQEDYVGMGANAGNRCLTGLDHLGRILAIEALCALRALSLAPRSLGAPLQALTERLSACLDGTGYALSGGDASPHAAIAELAQEMERTDPLDFAD